MLKAKGIYDGTHVVLFDPLPLPPHTPVKKVSENSKLCQINN
jgi:hypothetical protein